jgi:N-acetylmuramoyl-L-alanine amidase
VEDDRVARHVVGYNQNSIGIEIVNLGRYPKWFHSQYQECTEPYTQEQIESVEKLLQLLKMRYPGIRDVARHSDLDTRMIPADDDPALQIRRKVDPGPLFPWDEVLKSWENLNRAF